MTLRTVSCLALACRLSTTGSSADDAPAAGDVKVMSFNVRFGTAKEGENHWDRRKEEALGFQRDFLAERLKGHGVLGVGAGRRQGEG